MQHIKDYMTKIEQAIAALDKSKIKPSRGGLLSPSTDRQVDKPTKSDGVSIIAKYVNGIRMAREEIKNGK